MKSSKNVFRQTLLLIIAILLCLTNFHTARSQCSSSEWACDNGQCISDEKLCDGAVNCRDRSDEIAENCMQFRESCPEFAFTCAYGACIDGKAKCNGIQNCADNSDELICVKKPASDFQGTCPEGEIQCVNSKECIDSFNLCDGHVHCKDGSDEKLETCVSFDCVSYSFRCGYGACIAGNAKCNRTKECADGSDEAWELCQTERKSNSVIDFTPTATSVTKLPTVTRAPPVLTASPTPIRAAGRCVIPFLPQLVNLVIKKHPFNETINVGSFVNNYETLHIACKNSNDVDGHKDLICINGQFDKNFPSCTCSSSLLNRLSLRFSCSENDYCTDKILLGTTIEVRCAYGYTRVPNEIQYLKCLENGSFDKIPKGCKQKCGKLAHNAVPLSKDGIQIDVSSAPWHVAIFEYNNASKYIYICGGSIVSPRVILSAAHCFWDEANTKLKEFVVFQIIAGRSISNYTTQQNERSQIVNVERIHLPKGYEGKKEREKGDMAFLRLETPLKYTFTVAPICLPQNLENSPSAYIESRREGFMTSFGEQKQLEVLKMITYSYNECKDKSPYDAPLADDKFCIYNNEGSAVCRGDSGAAFFIAVNYPDGIRIERIYTFLGVVSNTPVTLNQCTPISDKAFVAITSIYYVATDFQTKLINAMREDEQLF